MVARRAGAFKPISPTVDEQFGARTGDVHLRHDTVRDDCRRFQGAAAKRRVTGRFPGKDRLHCRDHNPFDQCCQFWSLCSRRRRRRDRCARFADRVRFFGTVAADRQAAAPPRAAALEESYHFPFHQIPATRNMPGPNGSPDGRTAAVPSILRSLCLQAEKTGVCGAARSRTAQTVCASQKRSESRTSRRSLMRERRTRIVTLLDRENRVLSQIQPVPDAPQKNGSRG